MQGVNKTVQSRAPVRSHRIPLVIGWCVSTPRDGKLVGVGTCTTGVSARVVHCVGTRLASMRTLHNHLTAPGGRNVRFTLLCVVEGRGTRGWWAGGWIVSSERTVETTRTMPVRCYGNRKTNRIHMFLHWWMQHNKPTVHVSSQTCGCAGAVGHHRDTGVQGCDWRNRFMAQYSRRHSALCRCVSPTHTQGSVCNRRSRVVAPQHNCKMQSPSHVPPC
jgi:hypothetical protein